MKYQLEDLEDLAKSTIIGSVVIALSISILAGIQSAAGDKIKIPVISQGIEALKLLNSLSSLEFWIVLGSLLIGVSSIIFKREGKKITA